MKNTRRPAPLLAPVFLIAAAAVFGALLAPPPAIAQKPPAVRLKGPFWTLEAPSPVRVFIDPAHGGTELGARGPAMTLEKNITLKIARLTGRRLSADDRLEVVFSHREDAGMTITGRIDKANSARARLYLGIHTGGGRTPSRGPMRIFINNGDTAVPTAGEKDPMTPWEELNSRHAGENRELAEAVAAELENMDRKRGARIIKTGRLFLGGLDMPAVIVEPLDLANPEDEITLEDGGRLKRIADALAMGIIGFLMKTGEL
ncbi:MAG: N-acetylmuramoyl-L-alanine amidase family protein [Candidatus Nitrospinota bacterium M3_3B_026]